MKDSPFDRARIHDARQCLFGGSGWVRVWNLVPEPKAPFGAVLACELDPGASVGAHLQEHFSEVVIAVGGSANAHVNGEACELGPGAVIELPRGQTLALENTSKKAPFRYLIVKAAASSNDGPSPGSSAPWASPSEPGDS